MVALVELLLRERPFGGVRTFLGDRFSSASAFCALVRYSAYSRSQSSSVEGAALAKDGNKASVKVPMKIRNRPALRFISSEMRNCCTGSKCLEKTTRYSV